MLFPMICSQFRSIRIIILKTSIPPQHLKNGPPLKSPILKPYRTHMQTLILEEGTYAVFDYKGSGNDNRIFEYIFGTWLPQSEYELDKRPHFEVLGEKYKNNDPDSEEEIWIPIKLKSI